MNYILNESDVPVPCDDLTKWSEWYTGNFASHVIEDRLPNGMHVKTAFLGMDGRLWETTVYQEGFFVLRTNNYRSKSDAIDGHAKAITWAKKQ